MAHYFVWFRPVKAEQWATVYRWCDGNCRQHSTPAFGVCAIVNAHDNPHRINRRGIHTDLLGHGLNAGRIRSMVALIRNNHNAASGALGPTGLCSIADLLNNPMCRGQCRVMCNYIRNRTEHNVNG